MLNDTIAVSQKPAQSHALHLTLVCSVLLFSCLTLGMPLAILPIFLHERLGFGTVTVGLVIGLQSVATLLTRSLAGSMADRRGGRAAITLGAIMSALAGVAYALAALAATWPLAALGAVVAARLLLGVAESLLVTGGLTFSIATLGAAHTGKVMVWVGVAVYASLAFGTPLGAMLAERTDFFVLGVATCVLPMVGLALTRAIRPVIAPPGVHLPLRAVIGKVLLPGIALGCCTIGFAAIYAFTALNYAAHGWSGAAYPVTAFGICFIAIRFVLGRLPDRIGGARLALWTLPLQTIGQVLLWAAPSPVVAIIGAALTGAGYSLTYPALGIEVVRGVPPSSRGATTGAFMVFFDVGFGLGGPLTGLIVAGAGLPAGYLLGAAASLVAYAIALRMTFAPQS